MKCLVGHGVLPLLREIAIKNVFWRVTFNGSRVKLKSGSFLSHPRIHASTHPYLNIWQAYATLVHMRISKYVTLSSYIYAYIYAYTYMHYYLLLFFFSYTFKTLWRHLHRIHFIYIFFGLIISWMLYLCYTFCNSFVIESHEVDKYEILNSLLFHSI